MPSPTPARSAGRVSRLWDGAGGALAQDDDALIAAAAALRAGKIVAVKGLGGFHLFADARDDAAVRRLRARKRREAKPFAVMVPDHCRRARLLAWWTETRKRCSPARRGRSSLLRRTGGPIAPSVAPDNARLGVLLPYTPLHHLLMRDLGFPVVATSGNLSDEPIVTDEQDALVRLAGIADLFLVHDRPILRPVDDSVAQIVCGRPQLLRRARGYAPAPIPVEGGPGACATASWPSAAISRRRWR